MDIIGKDHDLWLLNTQERIASEQTQLKKMQLNISELKENLNHSTFDEYIKACSNMRKEKTKCHPGFIVAFDNIDLHMERRNMTLKAQNRDIHWVNHEVVENRVSANHLSNEGPKADLLNVPNIKFFPSIEDQRKQRFNYIVLVSRILVDHFSAFAPLKDACIRHIPHKYSTEMSKKSNKVNCELFLFSIK